MRFAKDLVKEGGEKKMIGVIKTAIICVTIIIVLLILTKDHKE